MWGIGQRIQTVLAYLKQITISQIQIIRRQQDMAVNFDALKAQIQAISDVVKADEADKAALVQAQADLATAQTTVDELTAQVAALTAPPAA
jgi:ABC-type hemin transport system substrate-binding protein